MSDQRAERMYGPRELAWMLARPILHQPMVKFPLIAPFDTLEGEGAASIVKINHHHLVMLPAAIPD